MMGLVVDLKKKSGFQSFKDILFMIFILVCKPYFENAMFWTNSRLLYKTATVKATMMVIVVFPDPLFAWLKSERFIGFYQI